VLLPDDVPEMARERLYRHGHLLVRAVSSSQLSLFRACARRRAT
jgi:hypothetical protein